MKRLALAFTIAFTILAAACSGKSKPPKTAGAGSGSQALYAKRYIISFTISQDTSSAEVFLQTTDEVGQQVSHSLGTFAGTCKVIKPAAEMHAVSGVNCAMAGSDK